MAHSDHRFGADIALLARTWRAELDRRLSHLGLSQARWLVLLRDAPLVILDEPFSGLDEATRERIKPRINAWLQGRSALLLGHSEAALPQADRLLSWQQLPRA